MQMAIPLIEGSHSHQSFPGIRSWPHMAKVTNPLIHKLRHHWHPNPALVEDLGGGNLRNLAKIQ